MAKSVCDAVYGLQIVISAVMYSRSAVLIGGR